MLASHLQMMQIMLFCLQCDIKRLDLNFCLSNML